jgi:hypothetical protein
MMGVLEVMQTDTSQSYSVKIGTSSTAYHLVVSTTGNVGIWTTAPGARLEVAGQIKITGGSPGAGKVLISDSNGLASWEGMESQQDSGVLPQAAGTIVVPAYGYYDHGNFNVTASSYLWFVYNCEGQLYYDDPTKKGNSLQMVGDPVVYSSSDWAALDNIPYNSCGVFYTGLVKVNQSGTIKLCISSYSGSVLRTSGPTANSLHVSLVKIY